MSNNEAKINEVNGLVGLCMKFGQTLSWGLGGNRSLQGHAGFFVSVGRKYLEMVHAGC